MKIGNLVKPINHSLHKQHMTIDRIAKSDSNLVICKWYDVSEKIIEGIFRLDNLELVEKKGD